MESIMPVLRHSGPTSIFPQICTVESSQGAEADFVLCDYVRSEGAGFTGQKNRMAITLTRATYLSVSVVNTESVEWEGNIARNAKNEYTIRMRPRCHSR